MKLRLPIIGQGLGPGGNLSCWLWRLLKILEKKKDREARHAMDKISQEEASIRDGYSRLRCSDGQICVICLRFSYT